MAMSTSVLGAQDTLKCQFCETDPEPKFKCVECNLLLCLKCCQKHYKIKDANTHRIINIRNVRQVLMSKELNFKNIPCALHPEQPCCLYCTLCEELVCPSCIAKEHTGHQFREIDTSYTEMVKKLDSAISELDLEETELDIKKREVNLFRENKSHMFSKLHKEIETQRQTYKNDIDKHFDKVVSEMQINVDKMEKSVDEDSKNILERYHELAARKKTATTLKSTRDALKFFQSTRTLLTEVKVKRPVNISSHYELKLKFEPKYNHMLGEMLGTIEDAGGHQVMKKILDLGVKKTYTTNLTQCDFITTCFDGSYSIAQRLGNDETEDVITNFHVQGDSIKTIFTIELPEISDIDTPPANTDILLADRTPILKVMNGLTGDTVSHVTVLNL